VTTCWQFPTLARLSTHLESANQAQTATREPQLIDVAEQLQQSIDEMNDEAVLARLAEFEAELRPAPP